jgi:hypothetical protein
VAFFGDFAANDEQSRRLRRPAVAASAEVYRHLPGPEVQESGGFRTLDDSYLRSSLSV